MDYFEAFGRVDQYISNNYVSAKAVGLGLGSRVNYWHSSANSSLYLARVESNSAKP
jgi:hypothetical protein